MAGRGNQIIVSSNPKGKFLWGPVTGTPKPGTVMQIDVSEGLNDDGELTWEAFNADADGNQRLIAILLENELIGGLNTTAYATGDKVCVYVPVAGEEVNVLKGDVAGTADDFAFGDVLMVDDGTGKVIATTGSPESEPFVCLEAITDPVADVLVHCMYTGY